MAILINDKTKCTGCEACKSICPKKCIEMVEDESGFVYPEVCLTDCIECKLCEKVCPLLNQLENKKDFNTKVYAGWSKNEETRYKSTSGGAFSEISKCILSKNGYIVGAVYDENCDIVHSIVADNDGLNKIRQSKYAQSKINDVYINIKELLNKNEIVLFCGAPCQIAGLKKFLNKDYDNLVTVDFICRGVNSPKAYKAWLSELENTYKNKVRNVWFKYKIHGWNKSPMCTRVDFENGKEIVQKGVKNPYMRGYLGPNLYIRPSCGDCQFKSSKRHSDITLADFWGVSKELDDDKGTSLILVNTIKGNSIFNEIKKNMHCEERSLDEILEGNACFDNSVVINDKSEEFLSRLSDNNFTKLINEYAPISYSKIIIERLKRIKKRIIKG